MIRMKNTSRREFLQTSSVLLAAAMIGSSFDTKKDTLNLSFSTLGCPDWTFQQIIDFAVLHGYSGLEIRGIQREMDLTRCNEFNSPENIKATVKKMKKNRLKFIDLGSSATLHFPEGEERKKNLTEAKRYIDLAQAIGCPFVRVFPNNFIKEQTKEQTIGYIVNGLLELGEYAKGSEVTVLLESHGDLVKIDDLEHVMQSAEHEHTGMIWDICNMWSSTGEAPSQAYARLKKYIRHTHIKDAIKADDKIQYQLLGKGKVPIFQGIDALASDGYKGYYSFEWEKLWHPEIDAPEVAIAAYPTTMNEHFQRIKNEKF